MAGFCLPGRLPWKIRGQPAPGENREKNREEKHRGERPTPGGPIEKNFRGLCLGGDVFTAKSGASNPSFFFAASGGEWTRTKRFGETDYLFNFAPARGDCPCFRTSGICCKGETRPWCISHIYNRYGRISRIRKARGYYDSIHPKYFLYKGAWSLPNKLSEYTAPHYRPVSHDRTNCPIKIRIDLNPD